MHESSLYKKLENKKVKCSIFHHFRVINYGGKRVILN